MDGMILKRGGDPSKLKTINENYVATEGQTQFPIEYSTFDYKKDTVFVISGRTILTPDLDYTLVGNKVVLVEGVPKDRTVTIRILKNVNTDAVDKTMSGAYIEKASIPLDRLAEEIPQPTAESLGAVKEEDLPQTIQSLLTGGEISMIKSIQRGVIGFNKGASNTSTINEVDTTKAVCLFNGVTGDSEYFSGAFAYVTLENSTTVKATREGDYSNTDNWVEVAYTVVEYY